MAGRRRAPAEHVYLAKFAHAELDELVHDLWTKRDFDVSPVVLLGSLVLAARRLPLDLVQALIPAYIEQERGQLVNAPEPTENESS
jgi:hypothetical protein